MKIEAWQDADGLVMTGPDQVHYGNLSDDAELLFAKEFDTWEEACTYLHEFMGWEPYVPMECRKSDS